MAAAEDNDDMNLELTKKKKKKKTANLDELIGNTESTEVLKQENGETPAPEVEDELSLTNLKKKKKKKKFVLDDEDGEGDKDKNETGDAGDEGTAQEKKEDGEEEELDLTHKKKKKKGKEVAFADQVEEQNEQEEIHVTPGESTWAGTDRDYTYEELLARVFDIMRKKNPEMVAGEKKRFIMRPPQCARVGTRKTSFINFTEICAVLRRQPKHCLSFILAELGTSGSVDGNNQLIIKGRFQQKQLESVLRSYIKEYVTCHTCRSPDTVLERKDRLYFLRCNVCQSRCSVVSIKSGFQAVTGRRARMRARAT
ncbi:eukaryotic translation initiation factor 2 subunit 2-like [Styela clava]